MPYLVTTRTEILVEDLATKDEALEAKRLIRKEFGAYCRLHILDDNGDEWVHSRVRGWLNCSTGRYEEN